MFEVEKILDVKTEGVSARRRRLLARRPRSLSWGCGGAPRAVRRRRRRVPQGGTRAPCGSGAGGQLGRPLSGAGGCPGVGFRPAPRGGARQHGSRERLLAVRWQQGGPERAWSSRALPSLSVRAGCTGRDCCSGRFSCTILSYLGENHEKIVVPL